IYWETSTPFIYQDENGNLIGIEVEIFNDFKSYLKKTHNISLELSWQKSESFQEMLSTVENSKTSGDFAVSALSITYDRRQKMSFSPPYMSDISVMISSGDVPIVKSETEFDETFNSLTAISIDGTTYMKDLLRLKSLRQLDFEVDEIPSSGNVLLAINDRQNVFGYIDLPIYLQNLNDRASLNIRRQNLFSIKREGYAIAYPKTSDWVGPMNEYFFDPENKEKIKEIISHHIDYEIYNFIESYYEDNVSLLTKEKEMQKRELQNTALQMQQETNLRYGLIAIALIILIFAIVVYGMYKKRHKVAVQLEQQKQKIETQRVNIVRQKTQLEKRSKLMTQYNDEKNNLIKILAHDLRSPINHIQGLANLYKLENRELTKSNEEIINKIVSSSDRLLNMISKILDIDAIEANRVNILEEKVDLSELLDQVIVAFEKEAEAKELKFDWHGNHRESYVKADPVYLTEVFENLISNAIKFSEKGKSITARLENDGDDYLVSIIDEGPGITEEDKQLMFQKFQTLSAKPTAGEQSTGLGLSIVKKYISLMNGEVWCESEPGQGATFKVKLSKFDSN
ncbi:transporter substrate-binding domain-containing protein, partial [Fulvivirga sp. RKSG066]|uniref:ATP-binding protein n=1 Tax=Fulvivirga aurantia TaxID=2529383 RepID=UPI0012BB5F7F